jgi:hypothetical protein
MEARVRKLEDDLAAVKTDLAVMRSNYVTKEDLHRELHATTWKIIGTFAVLCGAVFWIARNVAPPQAAALAAQQNAAATATSPPVAAPAAAAPPHKQ